MASYCCPLWGAVPQLRSLKLEWPYSVPLLSGQVQGMAALQQLSELEMLSERALSWGEDSSDLPDDERLFQQVDAQQLLHLVPGATQLQDLDVGLDLSSDSSMSQDQLVLELQRALPALTGVTLRGAYGEMMEAGHRAALRPGLVVGGC
jgi:hypothetical protein